MSRSVLILSASVGNGHVSAAKALEVCLRDRGFQVSNRDMLDVTPSLFRLWYAGGYELLVRRFRPLWGRLYWNSDKPGLEFNFQSLLDDAMCGRVSEWLEEFKPEWVICTHSLAQPTLARLRPKYGFRMGVCVTDLHPHLMWLRGAPDWYFVPLERTAKILAERQPEAAAKTTVTGIPIHSAFRSDPSQTKKRILVSAGGISGGPIVETIAALSKLNFPMLVMAGRNERLKKALQNINLPSTVEVSGNVPLEEMASLMNGSSLLIGKPGGLTTFESMACSLPLLIYTPLMIPGQEEDNLSFIVESGIGEAADNLDQLVSAASRLMGNPEALSAMRERALACAKPNAADLIADTLLTVKSP